MRDVCVVHCEASRAVGLLNAHTIGFMDAKTACPIAKSSIFPAHRSSAEPDSDISIAKFAWSNDGSMLAVALRSTSTAHESDSDGSSAPSIDSDEAPQASHSSHHISEIQIYDTSTGARILELPLEAVHVRMSWSANLGLLAVICKLRPSVPDWEEQRSASESSRTEIKLLRPALPSCHGSSMAPCVSNIPGYDACEWTPGGDLLLVWSQYQKARFLDPWHLDIVFSPQQVRQEPMNAISWVLGPEMPLGSVTPTKCILAYLQDDPCSIIALKLLDGRWHGQQNLLDTRDLHGNGVISPDGTALILRRANFAAGFDSIWHYDCKTQQEHDLSSAFRAHHRSCRKPYDPDHSGDPEVSTNPNFKPDPTFAISQPTWAHIPRGWSQLYACHHFDPNARGTPGLYSYAVSLVDAGAHQLLVKLSIRSLMELACAGRSDPLDPLEDCCKEVQKLEWSPNCKHLAVICNNWILIMSFARNP